MSKLTQAQTRALESVLSNARRARAYLDKSDIVIARHRKMATTTLDYTNLNTGNVLCPMNKQIGSDIAGLEMAITELQRFLTPATIAETLLSVEPAEQVAG
jgi:hypothetical protein